jgi:uracil-DNA glycosylase
MQIPEEIITALKAHLTEEWTATLKKKNDAQAVRRTPGKNSVKAEALSALEDECKKCRNCSLYKTAANLVFYDGDPDAAIVFVGEAPGADEDEQGKPFVGRAGKLLTAAITELGLPRQDVYICNILKHRPPENRNPLPGEIAACTPFLTKQLEILQPKVLITLGNFSTRFILKTEEGITKLRGNFYTSPEGYRVMPILHPAAILRNMNQLDEFKADLKKAIKSVK